MTFRENFSPRNDLQEGHFLPDALRLAARQNINRGIAGLSTQIRAGDADNITRLRTLKAAHEDQPAVRRRMYAPENQRYLEETHERVIDGLRDAELPPEILDEGVTNLEKIYEMAKEPADPEKSDFKLPTFAAVVGDEITRVRQAIRLLRSHGEKDADPKITSLRAEEAYLAHLLQMHRIPSSPQLLEGFYVNGQRKPDAKRQALNKEGMMMLRVGGALFCGTVALLNALVAIMANPKKPNLTAAAIWAAPTALLFLGKERLVGTGVQQLARETQFMQKKEFTGFAAEYGAVSADMMETLFHSSKQSELIEHLNICRNPSASKDAQDKAKAWLREELVAEGMDENTVNRMLQNPKKLADFVIPVLARAVTPEEQDRTLNFLRNGRAPTTDVVRRPSPLPSGTAPTTT